MCDCARARVGLGSRYPGEDALAGEEGEGKRGVSEEGAPGGAVGEGVAFMLVLV